MPSQVENPVDVRIRLVTSDRMRPGREIFSRLIVQLRGEPGCRHAQLLEDVQEPGDLTLLVKWRSERDFERYVCSAGFYALLACIDLAAEKPEVEVRTADGLQGMEYFQKLRGQESE